MINTFVILRVVAIESIGAFLDCGQEKDLFLPFGEQAKRLEIGDDVLVYVYIDNQDRPCSTMKFEKFCDKNTTEYKPEQKVDLIIYAETELGYKALINKKSSGILYKNEVFKQLYYGEEMSGYIKKVRDDGKVDLLLQPFGNKGSDDLGLKIIEALEENKGYLDLTDKTPPEKIYELFGVSKKKYKIALGGLYKRKLILIEEKGIKLLK